LFLCIISSTLILVVFRLLNVLKVSTLNAIIINYITAAALGLIAGGRSGFNPFGEEWFMMSVVTGFLFVFMFYVIGYSARVAGITLTSLTTKLSVVIPVLFSILVFGEHLSILKVAGMILAVAAIVMIVYRPRKQEGTVVSIRRMLWLPATLFFGAGFIDSLIKYSQEVYVGNDEILAFSATTFMAAALTSIILRLTGKYENEENRWYNLAIGGVALGVVNFGSLYFLVMALESDKLASSIIFGINNIGVVMLSVVTGMFFFGEKTTTLNKAGIALAIVSIMMLFYS
ncbi:MAG: DMT family transporter, partial [Bacteroidales bacterium]|nr:DMT family transporter [Bacteroidales bacterium]